MGIDEPSRNRIRSEIDKSFFISAGAGAGKTSLIVDRVIELLKAGKNPSEIVVITFTNAAAAELVDRITKGVRRLGLNIRIDDMNISTIHSFCYRLVSMRSFDANLGLSRRLLEGDEAIKMLEDYYNAYLAEHSTDPEFTVLIKWYNYYYNENLKNAFLSWADREDVTAAYDKALLSKSYEDFLDEAFNMLPSIKREVEAGKTNLGDSFNGYKAISVTYNSKSIKGTIIDVIDDIIAGNKREFAKELIDPHKLLNHFKKPGGRGKEDIKADIDKENENIIPRIEKIIGDYKERYEATQAVYGFRAVEKIVEAYQKDRDNNKITNDSLLHIAARMTRDRDTVRFFQDRYKYFFVDEYQDTDDVQTEIIRNLVRDYEKEEETGVVPVLKKGSLVVVGDLKQAIYRFRGADSTIFNKTKEWMLSGDKDGDILAEELSSNFRSSESIIDWVNTTFEPLFTAHSEDYEKMYVGENRKNFATSQTDNILEGVYKAPNDTPEGLAKLIKNLVESQNNIVVEENKQLVKRGIKYSDILILTRNATEIPNYAGKLRMAGIPVEVYGNVDNPKNTNSGSYLEKYGEVINLYEVVKKSLLRFAAYIEYLISPYDSRKRVQLIQLLLEKDYIEVTKEEKDDCIQSIKALRSYLYGMDALQLAGYFQKHIELILPKNIDVDQHLYLEIQKIFNGIYERLVSENIQSMDELSRIANDYVDIKKERLASLSIRPEAVTFMNMHKAKGLEAPIVIIANRGNEVHEDSSEYKDDIKIYPLISWKSDYGSTNLRTFANNTPIVKLAREAEKLDDLRLSYVAATRAREILIYMDSDNNCLMSGVTAGMTDITSSLIEAPVEPDDASDTDDKDSVKTYVNQKDSILEGAEAVLGAKTYVTMNPSGMEHKDGKHASQKEDRPKGHIFGNVMHRCFELIVRRRDEIVADPSSEDKIINAAIVQSILESRKDMGVSYATDSKKFADYLERQMKKFVSSSIFKDRICAAKEVYTEYEFSYVIDGEDGKTWVNGISDLVLLNADGTLSIIDYKSDTIRYATNEKTESEDDLREMTYEEFKEYLLKCYIGQLELYKAAMNHIFGIDEDKITYELYSMYE